VAIEESKGGDEEASSDEGEEDDGAAIGSLGCRWSGCGVVEALGAALRVEWLGKKGYCGEEEDGGEAGWFVSRMLRRCGLESGFLHCAALRSK
jgi:hypothetical protein